MRTHDDWPDDEAAAQLLADAEKKAGKRTTNSSMPPEKDFPPFGPMMSFPWQIPPAAFVKWAQQQGNPFVPFLPPPPLPADTSAKDAVTQTIEIDTELALEESTGAVDGSAPTPEVIQEDVVAQPGGSQERRPTSPQSPSAPSSIAPDLTVMPASTSQDPPARTKKRRTRSKTKTSQTTERVETVPNPTPNPAPVASVGAQADLSMDLGLPPNAINPLTGGISGMMPPWPMPPGMQFPMMMPPHMPAPLPPGMPFPPPAIAIPIPAGTPLPHPSQLPPNAQLISDNKGGNTVIIPPPPSPWGMPFPPGILPMPMFPGPPGPSLELGASNVEKTASI